MKSALLVQVPPGSCSRTLRPGEVKRVPARGPLVGYFLACPGCGFIGPQLADEAGLREEGEKLVAIDEPARCAGCSARVRIEDSDLVAE